MAAISFRGLAKRFGDVVAVQDFTLDVPDGELLVLVGPSGCGKTTTLRMLAGLEAPTAGEIWLGEREIAHLPARERNIAMVFQNYALYPHMSVAENVGFALRLAGVTREEVARRVSTAAEMMGIGALLERRPRELSGGQRQRVAVCRAIVRDPQAFLFDEPLSNLDAKLRMSARTEIRRLQQRLGVTTVYVTHDQVEAMTLADRMVVMHEGRIQQVGRPLDIYARPANTFVAGFIGSPPLNLLPVGAAALVRLNHPLLSSGSDVATIGVRPEGIALHTADLRRPLRFTAQLELVEALGAESLLHLRLGEWPLLARVPGSVSVAAGDWLQLAMDSLSLCFFGHDGQRIADDGLGLLLERALDAA
jgi:multiple sugar transport system ATP-binding protein